MVDVTVVVRDADGAELARGSDVDVLLTVSSAPGALVHIEVTSAEADTNERAVYSLFASSP
jgi:hypothetical protein